MLLKKGEKVKIEYYFENQGEETMYPKKIDTFKKKAPEDEWTHFTQIEYKKFNVQPEGKKIVDKNLPIGIGCNRESKNHYISVGDGFFSGSRFEFDYDLKLNYVDAKTKKTVTKKYSNSMYYETSEFNNFYWFTEIFVNDGVNEETNKPMRTFYDKSIQTFYDYYPEKDGTGKCIRHNYRQSESINWFYFQDIFIKNIRQFTSYMLLGSYLGLYKFEGVDSHVFERIINLKRNDKKNKKLTDENSHSKNLNNIISDYVIATYYYDEGKSRFPDVEDSLDIPFKMEFRLKGENRNQKVGNLTLDIKNFSPSFKRVEIFDSFKNCIEKSANYDAITIEYTQYSNADKITKNNEEYIKQVFRQLMHRFISPLR